MQDDLGLFDTPPNKRQIRSAFVVVGFLLAACLLILALRDVRLPEVAAFVPMVDSILFLGELIIATLLYAQATVFRSRALAVLASGYVFSALLVVPHALTFPGAFAPDGLLGAGVNTTAWLYAFRRASLPLSAILYVLFKQADAKTGWSIDRPELSITSSLITVVTLAVAVTLLSTAGSDFLPPFFTNATDLNHSYAVVYQFGIFALFAVAAVMLFRQRSSVLDLLLLVAFSGWLAQSLLLLTVHGRFTASWYGLSGMALVLHLVVLLTLIAESNWLYARLAVSTSAWKRERETRLMSIDAVAAAISHEIGQPLTGVSTHARAGLNWLRREPPDIDMATRSMQAAIDAGRRTTDVVKSVRAMFAKRPGVASEFSLNDLVLTTGALMDRELVGRKVALQFALDAALPPIVADRVQIQRVVVNLLTNAIESLAAMRGRSRHIAIRSAMLDDQHVLLEVSDNGVGIAPDLLPTIFEAFVSTKAAGGLGLWLSRTIVESNGGHLWATPNGAHGATFHLRLPCAGA